MLKGTEIQGLDPPVTPELHENDLHFDTARLIRVVERQGGVTFTLELL